LMLHVGVLRPLSKTGTRGFAGSLAWSSKYVHHASVMHKYTNAGRRYAHVHFKDNLAQQLIPGSGLFDARMQWCTHACSDARMQWCTHAVMHACSDARMQWCTHAVACPLPGSQKCNKIRVGQNRIYTPDMTAYLVMSLPKISYIYMVLANPKQN
jgi:hypothetical protein